ncbi:MAG: UDP-glucose 4-epimerase GalE [Ignavibacteria bacterium]|nr:UDP-glucose 4-epimerase GalE [Ignavibacteria bacterium]
MKVLVTGGAGYIGSHFVKLISEKKINSVVIDNLSRGHRDAVHPDSVFEQIDLLDYEKLSKCILIHKPDAVVHFAALAYVGESVENPLLYYQNNVVGSINLVKACKEAGINKFVFSSTCSLYGNPEKVPISENQKTNPINPYASTKLAIEKILGDFDTAFGMKSISLRYFNAAGADPSELIGESHNPEPHLIPIVLQTALGKREKVFVFGNDYNTADGTCIRDYIHVNDLADAHLKALNYLANGGSSQIINLGTGNGNSVLEIINKSMSITGKKINYEFAPRRPGDPDVLVADFNKAKKLLNWEPDFSIEEIISTAWNWHKNPKY